MNREKLRKQLSQLYIGQAPEKLVKEYYKKKHKEIFLIIVAGVILILLCFIKDLNDSALERDYGISRNEAGEGKENIRLQFKTEEGEWQEIAFDLYPKIYSEEELEILFLKASNALEESIKKDNKSLKEVTSDLEFIEEMEGYPFVIQWTSTPEGFIDEKGHLIDINKSVDEIIKLKAVFIYEDWKKEKLITSRIVREEAQDVVTALEQQLKVEESDTRDSNRFYLPKAFENKIIQWRHPPEHRALVLGILFVFLIPFIAYEKDKEIQNCMAKRREQLQDSFPEFITKLILLLEAGLSIRAAMFHMVEDYRKVSHKDKIYLYEELSYICRQIKNGMPEKEGYELLGKRCSLPCYKKMSGMLIQHLYKGGNHILEELKNEAIKAGEEQKRIMQKKGEEMGTKLLFSMILMLGIVMVFIMAPALFSFQI